MCKRKKKDEIIFANKFTYKDLTAMEEFLEIKQQEGLQLVKCTDSAMTFKKCEPSHSRYSCEIFRAANRPKFDEEYIAFCEESGWKFVTSDLNGLYIFKTDDENVTDIMTDDQMKFSIIAKSFGRRAVLTALVALAYIIFDNVLDFNLLEFYEIISNQLRLSKIIIMFMLAIICIINAITELSWLIKRKVELKKGERLRFNNSKDFEKSKLREGARIIIGFMISLIAVSLQYDHVSWSFLVYSALFLIPIFSMVGLMRKNSLLKKSAKKKMAMLIATSVAVVACALTVSFRVLPPIPDDTALAERIVAELDFEDDEYDADVDASRSRFAQHYDAGWRFKMQVSRLPKIKNKYLEYMIDYYGDVDSEYKMTKQKVGELEYYEFVSTEENYKYAIVAVIGDYVISFHSPAENAVEALQTIFETK